MAHVVSFLVDERVRQMRGGVEADARAVGKMMDVSTIPQSTFSRPCIMRPLSSFYFSFAP